MLQSAKVQIYMKSSRPTLRVVIIAAKLVMEHCRVLKEFFANEGYHASNSLVVNRQRSKGKPCSEIMYLTSLWHYYCFFYLPGQHK